ncbi:MAG: hypothetical protein IPJ20_14025 [Flammeovirgaceae bacterium]|nr:hypothetical protein [Flammeovirgaceae bacterium]
MQRNEKRSDFNLMHLLYRIDISEAQLEKYLNEYKNETYFNVIAELIIKRVLQKGGYKTILQKPLKLITAQSTSILAS